MSLKYANDEGIIASRLEVAHNSSVSKIRGEFFVSENTFFKSYIQDQRVLVAGSGLGHDAFEIARYNKEVVGVELLGKLVSLAKEKLKKSNVRNLSFVQGDILNLPYKRSTFDSCILNMGTIGNFDDKKTILNKLLEVARVVYFDFYPPILTGLETRKQMYAEEGWVNVRIQNGEALVSDDGLFSKSITQEYLLGIANELGANISFFPLNNFAIMAKIER
jgi:SAM-dependent methyltransferase